MLINLHVKNLALIEEADINFNNGLNILSGETGAGKSILIGSICAALGAKVNADFIRRGAEYGLCELTFKVESDNQINELKKLDVSDLEDNLVIITRKITPAKSTIRVNGETKTIQEVKQIASHLIDIHGQNEHQSLLKKETHLKFIDKYAFIQLKDFKNELNQKYTLFKSIQNELMDYNEDPQKIEREIDYINYELNEIDSANLCPGEDEELETLYKKYTNSSKIIDNISAAFDNLSNNDNSVSNLISDTYKLISKALMYDDCLNNIFQQIEQIEDLINGVNSDLSDYLNECEFDEEEYNNIDDRLNTINKLKQKYGKTIEDIFNYRAKQSKKLEKFNNYNENKEMLLNRLNLVTDEILELCDNIHNVRVDASKKLEKEIINSLKELNFLDVRFEIVFSKTDRFDSNGNDEVDFIISTNPGEDLKPLSKVASGGEMSRIMLAIKTVLANKDEIETLIFDEIDTGISGRTAQMVSAKLSQIAAMHQVLCITHLPQIAAMADSHYCIEKTVSNETTYTNITKLDNEESVMELARLLGGVEITESVINNAKEMKDLAQKSKNTKFNN